MHNLPKPIKPLLLTFLSLMFLEALADKSPLKEFDIFTNNSGKPSRNDSATLSSSGSFSIRESSHGGSGKLSGELVKRTTHSRTASTTGSDTYGDPRPRMAKSGRPSYRNFKRSSDSDPEESRRPGSRRRTSKMADSSVQVPPQTQQFHVPPSGSMGTHNSFSSGQGSRRTSIDGNPVKVTSTAIPQSTQADAPQSTKRNISDEDVRRFNELLQQYQEERLQSEQEEISAGKERKQVKETEREKDEIPAEKSKAPVPHQPDHKEKLNDPPPEKTKAPDPQKPENKAQHENLAHQIKPLFSAVGAQPDSSFVIPTDKAPKTPDIKPVMRAPQEPIAVVIHTKTIVPLVDSKHNDLPEEPVLTVNEDEAIRQQEEIKQGEMKQKQQAEAQKGEEPQAEQAPKDAEDHKTEEASSKPKEIAAAETVLLKDKESAPQEQECEKAEELEENPALVVKASARAVREELDPAFVCPMHQAPELPGMQPIMLAPPVQSVAPKKPEDKATQRNLAPEKNPPLPVVQLTRVPVAVKQPLAPVSQAPQSLVQRKSERALVQQTRQQTQSVGVFTKEKGSILYINAMELLAALKREKISNLSNDYEEVVKAGIRIVVDYTGLPQETSKVIKQLIRSSNLEELPPVEKRLLTDKPVETSAPQPVARRVAHPRRPTPSSPDFPLVSSRASGYGVPTEKKQQVELSEEPMH